MFQLTGHKPTYLDGTMIVTTALQQNLDKVQAASRDLERLEERAGQLREAMMQLLVQHSSLAESNETQKPRFLC